MLPVPLPRNVDGPQIAVVGRMTPEKNHRLALHALAELKRSTGTGGCHLHLVGEGPLRGELEALVDELGLRDQVSFHGYLENPYPLIRAVDAVCIPSRYEGLPNVALEAMGLGTAVVATRCSSAVETLIGEDARGQLVPADDARALAESLKDLDATATEWRERTRQAAEWVERHHGFSSWMNAMQDLFRDIVPRRGSRS